MEVLRCSCSMLGCNPSLLHSVPQAGCRCQDPSRRSVSSGAGLAMSKHTPVEVREAAVHSCDVALVDLSGAGWDRSLDLVVPRSVQSPLRTCDRQAERIKLQQHEPTVERGSIPTATTSAG
jgi:hypothetical protein